ncbi:uncharacterized protein V6R79_026441 [Siganus canaliculatus]
MEPYPHPNDSNQMKALIQPGAPEDGSSRDKTKMDSPGPETRTKTQSETGGSKALVKYEESNTPTSPGFVNDRKVGGSRSPMTGKTESSFSSWPSGPKESQGGPQGGGGPWGGGGPRGGGGPWGGGAPGSDVTSSSGRSTETPRRRIKYVGSLKHEMDLCTPQPSGSSAPNGRAERRKPQWEDVPSRCCSLGELKRLPRCQSYLGPLSADMKHTVLVDVHAFNSGADWRPHSGPDLWSHNLVKMPNSQWSEMNIPKMMNMKKVKRWDVISEHLTSFSKKKSASVKELEKTILKYNPKYVGQWSFDGLSSFVKAVPKTDNYYETLFPKIAALAVHLPDSVKKAVPLLTKGHPATITLSQVQVACLLANAFFCTFPHRNTSAPNAEYSNYPTINFNSLFGDRSERKKQKLRALMHYFNVMTDEKTRPNGLVTFERRCLRGSETPDWRSCLEKMPKLHVSSSGAIEKEGEGMLQVDFAASRIGGGVLGSSLVQEDVLFLINPELILSRLFTEKLEDNECLVIKGSQQFSAYTWFSDSFEWTSPHEDRLERDSWKRRQRHILAIDAHRYRNRMDQYNMRKVTRELNKAYCGFRRQQDDTPDIATGKWGCGAFNGDPQLKAIIQLMAAAVAGRGLAFFTFHDYGLQQELEQVYTLLVTRDVTVGKLYGLLEDYCDFVDRRGLEENLFDFICRC